MSIAYAWSSYKSTCAICFKEIKRRDGIGIPVDDADALGSASSRARWAHARCADAWQREQQSQTVERNRSGYAMRKGLSLPTGGVKKSSKVAVKYDGRKPSRKSNAKTLIQGVKASQSGFRAFEEGSGYALYETRIAAVVSAMCDYGVRIDPDLLSGLLRDGDCSETVKSVARFLVGDRAYPCFSVSELTGRISFKQPNLGSLGKDPALGERSLVIAEEGHVLFTGDMAQIEARVVAGLCQDPEYMDQFAPGRDVHAEMAERLLGSASHREKAKKLVHGINYGLGKAKLAEAAQISISDAETFVRSMARQFPIWASWTDEMIQEGRRAGQLTNVFGRTVPVEKTKANTQSVSRLVQSTARDIFFQRIQIMSVVMPIDSMRLLLHDEVILSVPVDSYAEHAEMTRTCLSAPWRPSPREDWIDLPVHISAPGTSWSQTRDLVAKVAA